MCMLCLKNDGIWSEFWPTAHETSPLAKARAKAMTLKKFLANMEALNERQRLMGAEPAVAQTTIDGARAQLQELSRIL